MKNQEKNSEDSKKYQWRELCKKKDEFQKIVKLLVDFDESTGRYRRYGDPESHFMRRSISVSDPELLRIFIQSLGGFIYYIVVELRAQGGQLSSSWIHEDGIRAERDEFKKQEDHPVHSIVCMTDLFENQCSEISEDFSEIHVSDQTQELLLSDNHRIQCGS
ncbi:MAG: hypothetical protein OEZ34_07405 [Spirochaetia bacterium]|nr:hypothetical protein [Spirochaetia bacterium]